MSVLRAIRMLLALQCDESKRLMSEGLDRDLSRVERWALRLHFVSCIACRGVRKQFAFLQQAARRRGEQLSERLSDEARQRIAEKIRDVEGDSNEVPG